MIPYVIQLKNKKERHCPAFVSWWVLMDKGELKGLYLRKNVPYIIYLFIFKKSLSSICFIMDATYMYLRFSKTDFRQWLAYYALYSPNFVL